MRREPIGAVVAAVVLSLAASSGCKTTEAVPTPEPPPPAASPSAEPLPPAAVDAALRSSFESSYVGLSVAPGGAVRLTLTHARDFDAAAGIARTAWVKSSAGGVREALPEFTFVQAAASPMDLNDAFGRMRDVLTLPGVVFLDLDEACGCITVGVSQPSAAPAVASFAASRGVAEGIVRTVATPPVVRLQALRDEYRPTMGGVQIQNGSRATCTLGLPTWSFRRGKYGFLTASHCTEGLQGEMQGTWIAQRGGRWFWGDKIGVERIDLPLFDTSANASCPTGRTCRLSDVAFADYDQSTLGIIGRIARPRSTCTAAGTACAVDVERLTDNIRLTLGIQGLVTGDVVDKVGRTSGWTRGAITNTCISVNISDRDARGMVVDTMITMLCQDRAGATSQSGDSGSPVFVFHSPTGTGIFGGILWGGSGDPTNPGFLLYSPISGIEQELGGFVYNQTGVTVPFFSNGLFLTSDMDDELSVAVERSVVPANEVQFVLNAGAGVSHRKEIVLAEGPAAGTARWTLAVLRSGDTSAEGLYTYQLPGGRLEFRKQRGNAVVEVSRVPIDTIPGGTRLTFTWRKE